MLDRICGTLKDTFTTDTLIKISSGKTHLENARYVNGRSKKRILADCIYPSLRKQIYIFLKDRKHKYVPKPLAQFGVPPIMGSLTIKVVFS